MPSRTMKIETAHFGGLTVGAQSLLWFPLGLPGFEEKRRWVLLTPPYDATVSWLQSIECPRTALAVVEPRRFLPEYQLRVGRGELESIELQSVDSARVLVTVNRTEQGLALDLKAPLVINPDRRLGRQVISNDDLPVRYSLEGATSRTTKRIA